MTLKLVSVSFFRMNNYEAGNVIEYKCDAHEIVNHHHWWLIIIALQYNSI